MFGDENIIELKVDDSNIKRAGWHLPSSIFYMEDIFTVITNIWWFVNFIAFVRQEIRTYIGWVTTITAFAIEGAVAIMVTLTMEFTT